MLICSREKERNKNEKRTSLAKAVRLVDVSLVDGTWDPATVTYNTRPTWGGSAIATCAVYGAGVWYSWDVSASVLQKAKDGEVSYVTGLNAMDDKTGGEGGGEEKKKGKGVMRGYLGREVPKKNL